MKNLLLKTLVPLLVFVLAGCGMLAGPTPTATPQPTFTPFVIQTEIPLPTAETVLPPTPTFTPEPTATPAAVMMIPAEVVFDSYQLRKGPGRLFARLNMYTTGDTVTLIGREESNNWVLVQTSDNRSGWMNVQGLNFLGDVISLPLFRVDNAQVIRGHVYLPGRIHATGIGVSLAPVNHDLSASTDVSYTNMDGVWAFYLPIDIDGDWIIGPNSYTCEESNAVTPSDGGCTLMGNLPSAQSIKLPYNQDVSMEFEILPLP